MITIEFVKVVCNGQTILVGRRFQDRWNLTTLIDTAMISYSRNQANIKKLRRMFANQGFTFTINTKALFVDDTKQDHAFAGFYVGIAA